MHEKLEHYADLVAADIRAADEECLAELDNISKHAKKYADDHSMQLAEKKIEYAKQKFQEDKTECKVNFVSWLNSTYVPESKRQPLPGSDVTGTKKKFARWVRGKISKHFHPDNFVGAPEAKQLEMLGIANLNSELTSMLKLP